MYNDVQNVNDVTDVVENQPDDKVIFLKLPKNRSCNDDNEVVQNSQRYNAKPTVI